MSEKTWDDCLYEGYANKVSKDPKKAESLKKTAEGRIKFFSTQKIAEESANYIFEGYYASIVELLHALSISEGYNISNHVCIGCFLREVAGKNDLYRLFDDLRYKRNSLVYYGNSMDLEICKDAIEKCKKLIKEIKEILK